jgi:hypothetical protein
VVAWQRQATAAPWPTARHSTKFAHHGRACIGGRIWVDDEAGPRASDPHSPWLAGPSAWKERKSNGPTVRRSTHIGYASFFYFPFVLFPISNQTPSLNFQIFVANWSSDYCGKLVLKLDIQFEHTSTNFIYKFYFVFL